MAISHVIRGEDHLSNTPKHILLFEALGVAVPRFAHLPLILNPDRTKMSKRKSQTAVADYRAQGFIPEGFVNYLALLGWSTGTEEEVLSMAELVERFELSTVNRAGAVFDRERLEWLNGQWIRRLPAPQLIDRLRPFLQAEVDAGRIDWMPTDEEMRALLPVVQERLPVLAAVGVVGLVLLIYNKPGKYLQWSFNAVEAARRQADTAKALGVPKETDLDLGNKVSMNLILIPAVFPRRHNKINTIFVVIFNIHSAVFNIWHI